MSSSTLPVNNPILTIDEGAAFLRVCRAMFYRLAKEHSIPIYKLGRRSVVRRDDLLVLVGGAKK